MTAGAVTAEYSKALDNASRRGIAGVDKELFMQLFQEARKEVCVYVVFYLLPS